MASDIGRQVEGPQGEILLIRAETTKGYWCAIKRTTHELIDQYGEWSSKWHYYKKRSVVFI